MFGLLVAKPENTNVIERRFLRYYNGCVILLAFMSFCSVIALLITAAIALELLETSIHSAVGITAVFALSALLTAFLQPHAAIKRFKLIDYYAPRSLLPAEARKKSKFFKELNEKKSPIAVELQMYDQEINDRLYISTLGYDAIFAIALGFLSVVGFSMIYMETGLYPSGSKEKAHDFATCLYFSIVTWTTLGFGDFSPTADARKFAASEAVYGLLFFAVMIGRFFGEVSSRQENILGARSEMERSRQKAEQAQRKL